MMLVGRVGSSSSEARWRGRVTAFNVQHKIQRAALAARLAFQCSIVRQVGGLERRVATVH